MTAAVEHVGRDQSAEQQALATEEQPHGQLVVAEPGGGRRAVGCGRGVLDNGVVLVRWRGLREGCLRHWRAPWSVSRRRHLRAGRNRFPGQPTARATSRTRPTTEWLPL